MTEVTQADRDAAAKWFKDWQGCQGEHGALAALLAQTRETGLIEGARLMQDMAEQACLDRIAYLEGNELYPAFGLNSQAEDARQCASRIRAIDPASVAKGGA